MGRKTRYHVQSTITEVSNPDLCAWWRACDNRSAVVREALTMYIAQGDSLRQIGKQLDRIEAELEAIVELVKN